MKAVRDDKANPGARHPTAALVLDRIVLNLSFFSATGLELSLSAPDPALGEREADVALTELSELYWEQLVKRKQKEAIDLDEWQQPDWASTTMCLAVGYPDEHKYDIHTEGQDKVAMGMVKVVAELADPMTADRPIITLSSKLAAPHGYYFSGISGGTVYALNEAGPIPAGIIFEGHPASGRVVGDADGPSLFGDHDIFVRALTLTPSVFGEWLERAKLL